MKKCLPAALVALLVLTAGCFSNSDVELVKNGSFAGYPSTTVGKILDSNFEKIKWSSSQTAIGETVVRFEGRISPKLHEKMDVALYQFLLMLVNHGVLAPDNTKEKLKQMTTAFHRLPQTLSEANGGGIDAYQHVKTESLPRTADCQKLTAATPNAAWGPDAIKNTKREMERLRRNYASTGSPYDKEPLDKQERLLAAIEATFTPEWDAKAEECIKIFESIVRDSIKTYFWTPGSQVFIEWKVNNNKKSFALSQFGGDGLPQLTFKDFLKEITSD